MADILNPTPAEQAVLDGILQTMRAGKTLQERRAARYAELNVPARRQEIDAALREYEKDRDKEKLQAVMNRWSFDISTFSEVSHGKTKI